MEKVSNTSPIKMKTRRQVTSHNPRDTKWLLGLIGGVTCVKIPQVLLCLLLTLTACSPQERSPRVNEKQPPQADHSAYKVLSEPPDAILDEWDRIYSSNNKLWRKEWTDDVSVGPLDGQRTIELLEIACYADSVPLNSRITQNSLGQLLVQTNE